MSTQRLVPRLTPNMLAEWLEQTAELCLFLDIDGTLSPFELNPTDSKIPNQTLALLKKLQQIGVPLAVVTGRSLGEARQMLKPLEMPIGATHGLEIAFSNDHPVAISSEIQAGLALLIEQIEQKIAAYNLKDFLLEKKPYSVALHYRQNPALAATVAMLMQGVAKDFAAWQVRSGKFVWEILPRGADKGNAVMQLLAHFNIDKKVASCPLFIGDDVSDEAGFLAVQAVGGIGVKVGEPLDYPSHADFFVQDIDTVSQVLQQIFAHCFKPSYENNSHLILTEPHL